MRRRLSLKSLRAACWLACWVLALGAGEAAACSCLKSASPCAEARTRPVVFVGTVTAVAAVEQASVVLPVGKGSPGRWELSRRRMLSVSLGVDEALKGVEGATVELVTATDTAACGFPFKVGETYLVFAYDWKQRARTEDEPKGLPAVPQGLERRAAEVNKLLSPLATNICTRTRSLAHAREDLELIRALFAGRPRPLVFGAVTEYVRKLGTYEYATELAGPVANVTVEAAGPAGKLQAVTDAEGRFRLAGLKAGKYKVRPLLPETYNILYGSGNEGVEVEVTNEGCGPELSFAVEVDGRVSGRVYDAAGRPVGEGVQVSLVTLDSARKGLAQAESRSEYTDAEGRYGFAGLPAGKYVLGVNIADPPTARSPYPALYYPASTGVEGAAVIALDAGQKLRDFDLRLAPRLAAGRVTGVVLLPDGRPAAGASVYLYDREDASKDAHGLGAETDARGRFTATCYKARRYLLRGVVYPEGRGAVTLESEKTEAACEENPAPVRLTVRPEKEGAGQDDGAAAPPAGTKEPL